MTKIMISHHHTTNLLRGPESCFNIGKTSKPESLFKGQIFSLGYLPNLLESALLPRFCNLPKFQRGTLIKCLVSMLTNLPETLHSYAKFKKIRKQPKFEVSNSIHFPEGLEDSPFNLSLLSAHM